MSVHRLAVCMPGSCFAKTYFIIMYTNTETQTHNLCRRQFLMCINQWPNWNWLKQILQILFIERLAVVLAAGRLWTMGRERFFSVIFLSVLFFGGGAFTVDMIDWWRFVSGQWLDRSRGCNAWTNEWMLARSTTLINYSRTLGVSSVVQRLQDMKEIYGCVFFSALDFQE